MTGRLEAAMRGTASAIGVLAAGLAALGLAWSGGGSDPPPPAPTAPVAVSAPAIHVAARVVPITLAGGILSPPADVSDVGWWRGSALPGARRGRVVMTGHTVHAGGGSLDRLGAVRRGDEVRVASRRSTVVYTVRSTRVLSHDQLAQQAPSLFGQRAGHGQLLLVTCSGWDGVAYERNLVVTADPTKRLPRGPRVRRR